jgi:K(+)-stimulated pyrophosphate-energized sodium pump
MIYPLSIGGGCILTSILGTYFVKLGKNKNIMNALYKGFIVTAITSLIILYPITDYVIGMDTIYNVSEKKLFWYEFISLWCYWTYNNWSINMGY